MFGIGSGELFLFAVVALIALGPKRLPEFMKMIGKTLREVRRATGELRKQSGIDELMREDPVGLRALNQEINRDIERTAPTRSTPKLSAEDRTRELPDEGVDIAHAKHLIARGDDVVGVAPAVAIQPAEGAIARPSDAAVVLKDGPAPTPPGEPTMLGVAAVDPYAASGVLAAKRKARAKASVPPPPPPRPSSAPQVPAPSSAPRIPSPSSAPRIPSPSSAPRIPSPSAAPGKRSVPPPPPPEALRRSVRPSQHPSDGPPQSNAPAQGSSAPSIPKAPRVPTISGMAPAPIEAPRSEAASGMSGARPKRASLPPSLPPSIPPPSPKEES